jgi:hypothetical protein
MCWHHVCTPGLLLSADHLCDQNLCDTQPLASNKFLHRRHLHNSLNHGYNYLRAPCDCCKLRQATKFALLVEQSNAHPMLLHESISYSLPSRRHYMHCWCAPRSWPLLSWFANRSPIHARACMHHQFFRVHQILRGNTKHTKTN